MRWPRLGGRTDWELGPDEQLVADELEQLADAAPPSRGADDIRMLVLRVADESAAPSPGGLGIVGMAAISLALAVLFGVGAVYVGSLVGDQDLPDPTNAASPTVEADRSDEPAPSTRTPRADASPTPPADAADEPSAEPVATPVPEVPGESVAPDDDDDDGPPPHASPGGPPSPMPGPPGGSPP